MINGNLVKLPITRILLVQIFVFVTIYPLHILRICLWYIHIWTYVFCDGYLVLLKFLLCCGITSKSNTGVRIVLYTEIVCICLKLKVVLDVPCMIHEAVTSYDTVLTEGIFDNLYFCKSYYFYVYVYCYCYSTEIVTDC